MRKTALLIAAVVLGALALSACQNTSSGDVEAYKRNHDRYMRTYEPKTGGPDV